jgi:hypothetical protein
MLTCKNLEFPFVKIPQESTEIKSYFNKKLECVNYSKSNDIIYSKQDKIFKINNLFTVYEDHQSIYDKYKINNYYPVYIYKYNDPSIDTLLDSNYFNFTPGESSCALCKSTHITGFKKSLKSPELNLYGKYPPQMDNTNLIFRNFLVVFNGDPYMPNHLMLISQNHDNTTVKGSQYDILNREVLSDVIDVFYQIVEEYMLCFNYILSGSQKHFHIHMIKKLENVNYGLDNLVDSLANKLTDNIGNMNPADKLKNFTITDTMTIMSNITEYKQYFNKDNQRINFACFKNNEFGYRGYLITMNKFLTNQYKEAFISVIFNFLNYIENSIEYSFNLYFPSSSTNLSVVVLVQSRKTIISCLNITQFVYDNGEKTYDDMIRYMKRRIEGTVVYNVFPEKDMWDVLYYKSTSEVSIYGNSNLRQIIDLSVSRTSKPSNFLVNFTKYITNKPSVYVPKTIIINGPIGSGKSQLFKNLKLYYPFYDESTYVHVNVDELLMSIPGYKKLTMLISEFFKNNYLTKEFKTYNNGLLHKYGDKSIKSLKDNNFMYELSIVDYQTIYNEMLGDRLTPISQKTIADEYSDYYTKVEEYRNLLLKHILEICIKNRFNCVIENARTAWDLLNKNSGDVLVTNSPNIYYLGYELPLNDFNEKFILRNVLLRNIEEGRIIDFNLARLTDYSYTINSYKINILPENFILINLGYTFLVNNNININSLLLTKNVILNHTFNPEICIQSNLQDKELQTIKINDVESNFNFLGTCLNIFKNMDDSESKRQQLKSLATSINNKYLLDENTISLLIYNTVINVNSIIEKVVYEHNLLLQNRITTDDIKLILKGGLNIRYIIKDFFSKFEKYINIEQEQLLNSIIKSMDSTLDHKNLFKNTTSKSDIDFTIIINKDKVTKPEYDVIRNNLRLLYIRYLLRLRNLLSDTNFFGSYHSIDKLMKNSDKLSEMNLTKMEKINNYNFFIDYPDKYKWNVEPEPNTNTVQILYAKTNYLIDPSNANPYIPESHYYISYQNLFIEQRDKKLDIIRLRNSYNFVLSDDETKYKIGGEIIDLTILDYDSVSSEYFENIKKVKYANNMYNFEFNIFNEDFLMPDILRMLFYDDIFPWKNPKIDKRFSRYLLLLIIKYFKQKSVTPDLEINFSSISADLGIISLLHVFDSVVFSEGFSLSNVMKKYNITDGHLLHDLFNSLNSTIEKVVKIKDDGRYYTKLLAEYGYSDSPMNYDEIIKEMNNFILLVSSGFKHLSILVGLCEDNINKTIIKEIKKSDEQVQLVQWGGFQRLYSIYKNYYMELKGGALFNANKINTTLDNRYHIINDLKHSHRFTTAQITYIELLFLQVIPNLEWNGTVFNEGNVRAMKPLSCGSFGCGFLLTNDDNDKIIIKICGASDDGNSDEIDNNEYLKEILGGYYATANKPDIFNKTFGYFITSSNVEDNYFKSNDTRLKYSGAINNSNPIVRNGNILAIFMSAGDGDLSGITKSINKEIIKNHINNLTINELVNTLISINTQLFKIGDITTCSAISKKCIYLTHNDIKPPNIIYKLENGNKYKIEYIDYGGFIFSDTFFTNIVVSTPVMKKLVYGDLYGRPMSTPTSPLYDIASAIYTMFIYIGAQAPYYEYDTIFNKLKSAYFSNNISDIETNISELRKEIYSNINKLFFRGLLQNIETNPQIYQYVYMMIQYINLAMCIYRYHANKIIRKGDYSDEIFSGFQILEIGGYIKPSFVEIGASLTDRDLLKTIMDYVKVKTSGIQ